MKPPGSPWQKIALATPPTGYLSFYFSDQLSGIPVRAVTLPGNQKADPNLETATYGLFSTCERFMRTSIVHRGVEYIFFLTSRKGEGRFLTGFYRLKWYYEHAPGDCALAAADQHFVFPSLGPRDLPASLRKVVFAPFRASKQLSVTETEQLLEILLKRKDSTNAYLEEIDRLERFNLHHTGFRHWGSSNPFNWEDAEILLKTKQPLLAKSTASPSNNWKCKQCKALIFNRALLRRCPKCNSVGTLQAVLETKKGN